MNPSCRYAYNLPWRGAVAGAVFYAGLAILMIYLAKGFAGIVFIGLIAFSAMFAVLAVVMLLRRPVFPRVLELTDDAVLFPHGFPRTRITRIPFSKLIRMSWTQTGLHMVAGKGRFEITASHFEEIENYRKATDFVCTKSSFGMPRQGLGNWTSGGFPDPILRWKEPEEWPRYRTALAKSEPILNRLGKALWFFARCFGVLFIPWLLLHLFGVPTAPAVSYLCLIVTIAFLITLIFYWLATIWPVHCTEISFRDNGITQFFGKQTADWNYSQFSGWAMIETHFQGCILHILLLKGCNYKGRSYVRAFALPETGIRDRLDQLLHEQKIPQKSDIKPPWE